MEYTLTAKPREKKGKEHAKKLRREGWIPAIMYGRGEENTLITINIHEFETFFRKSHGENVIVTLKIEGAKDKKVIVKDVQRDPVYGKLEHIDFQIIHEGEKIMTNVPIILKGTPKGVKEGGVLEQNLKEVQVIAIPSKLPQHIEFNIEDLEIGDMIKVGDIKIEGVEVLDDPEEIICMIHHGRKEEEITPTEEEGEATEEQEEGGETE